MTNERDRLIMLLDSIDGDLQELIFCSLSPESITMTAATCWALHRSIMRNAILWRTLCTRKYRHCHSVPLEREPWRLYANGNGWDKPAFLAGEVRAADDNCFTCTNDKPFDTCLSTVGARSLHGLHLGPSPAVGAGGGAPRHVIWPPETTSEVEAHCG